MAAADHHQTVTPSLPGDKGIKFCGLSNARQTEHPDKANTQQVSHVVNDRSAHNPPAPLTPVVWKGIEDQKCQQNQESNQRPCSPNKGLHTKLQFRIP